MRLPIAFGVAFLALACSKDPAPGQADFARGGVPDDSVKTAQIVSPTPAPTPTFTVARGGIPDDSIKPIAKPAATPTSAPVILKPALTPAPAPTPR